MMSCQSKKQAATDDAEPQLVGPVFDADSTMLFCAQQCDFGPRTMNSTAHDECEKWIIGKFKQYGCEVTTQKADLKGWDGTTLHSTNIIARTNPEATERIIICAHWDSRPWADNDPDENNHRTPVMAANDGASGVAVMIELARIINNAQTSNLKSQISSLGIDFVCFDAEDYGTPTWSGKEDENSWALGAQHYANNLQPSTSNLKPQISNLKPQTGILLDMVGGQGAKFYQEGLSKHYAQNILDDVWQAAAEAGYGSFFVNQSGGYITDDHKPLNEAGIPTIDIIPYYPDCDASPFGPTWHTVNDDIHHIDKNTLKAVGQTLVQYLYTIDHR
ncbi:MAG: M28 family peptidase [Prevotella sp.]|nr:M28 family peptidase [Prevotella sp.]